MTRPPGLSGGEGLGAAGDGSGLPGGEGLGAAGDGSGLPGGEGLGAAGDASGLPGGEGLGAAGDGSGLSGGEGLGAAGDGSGLSGGEGLGAAGDGSGRRERLLVVVALACLLAVASSVVAVVAVWWALGRSATSPAASDPSVAGPSPSALAVPAQPSRAPAASDPAVPAPAVAAPAASDPAVAAPAVAAPAASDPAVPAVDALAPLSPAPAVPAPAASESELPRPAPAVPDPPPVVDAAETPGDEADETPGDDAGASAVETPGDEAGAEAVAGDGDAVRGGEVHVHDDGFVHTHGAGAPASWTVEYTQDGQFVPERLDIVTGDEVVFLNASDRPVWPASNIHPTHEILPSFDPQQVIWPGDSWSYRFDENGYWRYHNHIEPSETGLVVSLGGPQEDLEPLVAQFSDLQFPAPPADADGAALMGDVEALEQFVRDYGPEAAVAVLKRAELATGSDCHDAAHVAGRVAYEAFGPAAFVLSGHECQAGSLHGATEALFADRGTSRLEEDIAAVCSSAQNPFVLHQCLHGVGHGLMAWTTYELHEALELCDVVEAAADRGSCYSGVFMENVVGGLSGLMGHRTDFVRDDDPHFPCDVVAPQYAADCYFYQTSHMLRVLGGDFAAVARECAGLGGRSRELCFGSFGRDVGSATRGDPAGAVELCGHAPAGADRVGCITGAVQDRFWEPSGAEEAQTMCWLLEGAETRAEAEACWDMIIWRARDVLVTPEDRRAFCAAVPPDRKASCEATVL